MALSKKTKKRLTGVIVGISVGLSIAFSTHYFLYELFEGMERVSYDFRYLWKYVLDPVQHRAKLDSGVSVDLRKPMDGITIVDIDERSMAKLGPFHKWPRSYHGDVVETLTRGGASSITFDIMFKTADFGKSGAEEVLKVLQSADNKEDWSKIAPLIQSGLNYDSMLTSKLAQSPVLIGAGLMNGSNAYPNKSDWEALSTPEWHKEVNPQSSAILKKEVMSHFETKPIFDNIFKEFGQACSRVGLVNVVPDGDGIHRSLPLFFNFPDTVLHPGAQQYTYTTITIQTALHLLGKTLDQIEIVPGSHVNLGAPIRVSRKEGRLESSYPNFTVPMLLQLMRKKDRLRAISKENPSSVPVSTPVIVKRTETGEIEADVLEGGYLTQNQYLAITNLSPDLTFLDSLSSGEGLEIASGIVLGKTDTKDRYLVQDTETGDECNLDRYTFEVLLRYNKPDKVKALKAGETLTLSGQLELSFDVYRNRLSSPILALTQPVLESVISAGEKQLLDLSENKQMRFGPDILIPLDEQSKMLIHYMGKAHETFRYISYYDVIAKRLDPTFYQGKSFLLGSSAASMFDIVASTFEEDYPGVEIHATVLQNIMTGNFIQRLAPSQTMLILIILGLCIGLATYFFQPLWSIAILLFSSAAYFTSAMYLFDKGLWVDVARPEMTLFLTFLFVFIVRYIMQEKDKKFLNDAFKNYISPELIDIMIEKGQKPELGGKEDILTAYFTDIQGFSTFSEKLGSPTKLVELLNEYLSAMTDILMLNNGTLDKYEGDAIIAFFGAPMRMEDHAVKACTTALHMQNKLAELRQKWHKEGEKWPEIVHNMRMRIGINSGPIVTGNMGSSVRMNYTMMGDTVNLAARLESGAKMYGVYSMASEDTVKLINGSILYRELDLIKVMGKSLPVRIYELVGPQDTVDSEVKKCVELFSEGLGLYRQQNWDAATEVFQQSLKLEQYHPSRALGCKTTPSDVFIERCGEYKLHVPAKAGEIWDGVYTATEK